MSLSVECQEEVAFLPPDIFERQARQLPDLARAIAASQPFDECEEWDVAAADPSIDAPVDSDIPALLLVGEYDPVHPRESAEAIVGHLSNATLVELPGLGHGTVGIRLCPTSLMASFIDGPTAPVDTTCVDRMGPPDWFVPA
jgi:hypothetical protein